MAVLNKGPTTDRSKVPAPTPSLNSMKFPHLLRRGSSTTTTTIRATSDSERSGDKNKMKTLLPGPERRSSLPILPLRLRRRKTTTVPASRYHYNEHEAEAAEQLSCLFFALPSEIVAQIITNLEIADIYSLRLTSRTFQDILDCNTYVIGREILPRCLPPEVCSLVLKDLFPITANRSACVSSSFTESGHPASHSTSQHSLSQVLTILRRQSMIDRQIYNVLAFVQVKVYMTRTATRLLSINDNRQRLIEAFQRPAWIVTHFLEKYRDILIYQHPRHLITADKIVTAGTTATSTSSPDTLSSAARCTECLRLARTVVSHYPEADVLPAWHFHQLSMEHLRLAMRAPSSSTGGRLRGRHKAAPASSLPADSLAVLVILGGIPEVRKIAMMQGSYNSRMNTLSAFVASVRDAIVDSGVPTATAADGADRRPSLGGGDAGRAERISKSSRSTITTTATTPNSQLASALSPPLALLTHDLIASLPNFDDLFYDVWKERIRECIPPGDNDDNNNDNDDVESLEPYPWLQQVMSGSGVEFAQSRIPEPPLALGASPI